MSIENHIKSQQEAVLNDINTTRDRVFTGLVSNLEVARLPESVFVNQFLPAFLGNPLSPNWIVEWISVAGSPASEVDVFDQTTEQVLFRVPPMLSTSNIMTNSDGIPFTSIMSRFDQLTTNLPQVGINFLNEALTDKVTEIHSDPNDVVLRWGSILKRYYPDLGKPVAVESQDSYDNEDELFDY